MEAGARAEGVVHGLGVAGAEVALLNGRVRRGEASCKWMEMWDGWDR